MTDRKPTILFVDDEENILSALRRVLRKENYELIFCGSPVEALQILKEQSVDIVVSDHLMPEMTGLEFVAVVKDLHPQTMRVILTGQADLELAVSAINKGQVNYFLLKPWNDLELKIVLKQLLAQRRLEILNAQLTGLVTRQNERIKELEKSHPGISKVERDDAGAIVLDEEQAA
ncbi:MAG: response regulator [Pseudomonadota bacterium]